jgi:hypothetical protein
MEAGHLIVVPLLALREQPELQRFYAATLVAGRLAKYFAWPLGVTRAVSRAAVSCRFGNSFNHFIKIARSLRAQCWLLKKLVAVEL